MIGFYSINFERFLFIAEDKWIALIAGRLLSSKFSLSLIEFDNSELSNENCHTWSIKDTGMILSDRQLPRLQILEDQVIDKQKPCTDISLENFYRYKEYCKFVYNVVLSSRMTDALLNSCDHNYILSLYTDVSDNVEQPYDDTGWNISFIRQIDKILYWSESIDEAMNEINNIFRIKTDMVSNYNNYKKTFFGYLNSYEANI
jgi:hypothetical protein